MKISRIFVLAITSFLLVVYISTAYATPLLEVERPSISSPITPASTTITSFSPRSGDEKLKRDRVYLDVAHSLVDVAPGTDDVVFVTLRGYLPSPCHQLRVAISPARGHGKVNFSVYSLFDPNVTCSHVRQPFTATISLGSFASRGSPLEQLYYPGLKAETSWPMNLN
jgi:hypothetical protein